MKRSELKQIIKEEIQKVLKEYNSEDEFAEAKAKEIAGKFSKHISKFSEDLVDNYDNEKEYDLEFELAFDSLNGLKPKEFEKNLKKQINADEISYNGYEEGKHMFFISQKVSK